MMICVVVAGCARPRDVPRLAVGSVRQPATSLFFVAQAAGCFAQEHVAIDERTFELGRDALRALQDGRADVAIAFDTPFLRAALADPRLRVLTKLHTSARNTRLVARASAGIGSFAHLREKRVGLARGTNAEFFAAIALTLGGVPRSAVTVVDLPPAAAAAALGRGELDAAILSDPFAGEAERLLGGDGRTLLSDAYVEASLLITREDVVASRPAQLRALVRGLACAEAFSTREPSKALALVAPRFTEESEAALAAQLARVRWGLGLDNVLVDVLRRERDWLLSTGATAARPALQEVFELGPLTDVVPESVTLLPTAGALRW